MLSRGALLLLLLGSGSLAVEPPGVEFLSISTGTCEGLGSCVSASSSDECIGWGAHLAEVANHSLPAADALNPSPLGCYLFKQTGKLYFNDGSREARDCSEDRRAICRCTPAIDVAFYHDTGASVREKNNVYAAMNYEDDIRVHNFSAFAVRSLLSNRYHDVVVFPGGGGRMQGEAIGLPGQAVVKDFVANGGGFVGICAGAFLAINQLKMVPVHGGGMRGDGNCTLELTDLGTLGHGLPGLERYGVDGEALKKQPVFYANGPTMKPEGSNPMSTDMRILARYTSAVPVEKHYPSDDPDVSGNGLAAVVATTWARKGTVVISGPHPETEQMDWNDLDGPPVPAGSLRATLLQSFVRYAAVPQPQEDGTAAIMFA